MRPQACDNAQIAEAILSCREFKGEYIQINEILWGFIEKMYGASHEVIIKDSNIQNKRSMKNKHEFFRGDVTQYERLRPPGITNELYFCYINAVVQALMGLDCFIEGLVQRNSSFGGAGPYTRGFLDIIKDLREGKTSSAKALKLLALDSFNHHQQHDAHEFFLQLISKLHEEAVPKQESALTSQETKKPKSHANSIVEETFGGQLGSRVTCSGCGNDFYTLDPSFDLSLSLNEQMRSLEDCLRFYFQQEELTDLYDCQICKTTTALRKMTLERIPTVLVLHLKSFLILPAKKKISAFVSFPINSVNLR